MKTYTTERTGIFKVDGLFFEREVVFQKDYDNEVDTAYDAVKTEAEKWFQSLPGLLFFDDDSKSHKLWLWGRLEISCYRGYEYELSIDDIPIHLEPFNVGSTNYAYLFFDTSPRSTREIKRVVRVLNDISTYGLESFVENYIKSFEPHLETLHEYVESSNGDEYKELKKKFTNFRLMLNHWNFWRPLGKTNDEMEELGKKLDERINNHN